MCVSAYAMSSVPSVTMNGGNRSPVTRPPLSAPKAAATSRPMRMASSGATPLWTANFVMTIDASAITRPQERSIPAVRMTSVWPIASVPKTITCWRISEKFGPDRNRSDWMEKNATAIASARTEAPVEISRVRSAAPEPRSSARVPSASLATSATIRYRLAPAVGEAVLEVLARHALHRLRGDQVHAGVVVARHLLAVANDVDDRLHTLAGHLQRVLLRGRRDLARLHRLNAGAAAVDGDQQRCLARLVQRVVGAETRRLVDRVDEVDVRVLLQAVLHCRLALGEVALRVLAAHDLGRVLRDPEAAEEAVVAQVADGDAGVEVHHRDDRLLALHRLLRVLADQLAGGEVVGRVQRVGRVLRLQRRVQRDDLDALIARLLHH